MLNSTHRLYASFAFFLLGLLLLGSNPLKATHIVGGEMGYTCLGDNQYEIRLTIYRDCFFGNPDAYFDDPASIGVFDSNNFLLQDIRIELMGDDTLSPVLTDECLVIPPDVCVHTTTYRTVVKLEPRVGGYQLAYQRCCRNQTIANIVDPLGTGATYGVTISERALQECNSSVEFLQWPPLYICANEPIIFDQSAIDVDGDSIVYRLCTPLLGADPNIPRPQPPNNPPYNEVVWNDPPYNVNNMLNGFSGGVPLQINTQTGLLTGTPNTVGQFVVGICAEEYRDGELIGTTRRDFQYNVGICGQTTSAFFAPEIQCDGLEVFATNESEGTDNFRWIFGDPANPLGSSTEEDPSFVFPDFGTYEITLIAADGEVCADTFSQAIELLPLSLQPAFALDTLSCGDSLVIQVIDLSTDSLSTITSYEWTLNGEPINGETPPLITITEMGNYEIGLTLNAENGCQNSVASSLQGVNFIQESLPADSVFVCPGDSVFLNPAFIPTYDYQWSPATGLNQSNIGNPIASPATTTTYELQITDPASGCMAERVITVVVQPPLEITTSPDVTTCEAEVTLWAESPTAIRYLWSTVPDFTSTVSEEPVFTVSPTGEQTFYILVVDLAGCSLVDSVTVNSLAVNLNFPAMDTIICLGEQLNLSVENIDPADVLNYNWEPTDLILSGTNTSTPLVAPTEAGNSLFVLSTSNQHGCERTDTITVTAVDPIEFGADLAFQQCSGTRVDFSTTDPSGDAYLWFFNDPLQPTATAQGSAVSHEYATAGNYQVMVTLPPYLACADTTFLDVTVTAEGTIMPDFSWTYLTCADTATIAINNTSTAQNTSIVSQSWYLADTLLNTESNFVLTLDSSSNLLLSLVTMADNGCLDTIQRMLDVSLIEFGLPDSLQVCPSVDTELNPTGNPDYIYQWLPSATLNDSTFYNPIASPVVNTTYQVTISDPNSICEREASVALLLSPEPSYALSPDTALCDLQWQISATSGNELTYNWSEESSFATTLGTTPTLDILTAPNITYYLQLTDSLGCQYVDSVQIDGRGLRVVVPPEQTVCINDTISLFASSATEYSITSYDWQPAEQIIGPNNESEVLVAPTDNLIVSLLAVNQFGCVADTFVRLNLLAASPPLSIVPARDTLIPGESVQLLATDSPTYTYEWLPSLSLDNPTVSTPFASPEETTTYQLTITDQFGCTNTAEALIVVFNSPCQAPFIFVPNAFSPNGDLLNDVLRVEANVIDEFNLQIYDRWGELVFESFSQEDTWDGTFKGRDLSPDVYGYFLTVSCFNGEQYTTKGNISLLR